MDEAARMDQGTGCSKDGANPSPATFKPGAETEAIAGRPREQLDTQDPPPEDDIVYPTGIKVWMAFASLCTVSMLFGLDLAIVAATVPSLTNYFKTVEDIGWYSSAYSLMTASFTFFYGKLYSLMSAKRVYIISISIFELGSLLCTVATTSPMFIFGRAVAGVGAAGIVSGSYVILSQLFPRYKRPKWITVMGSSQMIGIVSAPLIGGVLIDWVGWRGCFGINLPLGVAAIALVAFGYHDAVSHPGDELSWTSKLKGFDWLGTVFMVPAVTCLLLALQWGGIKFGWGDARIVILFILFAGLIAAFGWRQHQLQENATLPPRIMMMKSVLAASWFSCCANATLTVTEYYMSIYFQGVKGYTATQSGLHMTPLLAGITIGSLCSGLGVSWLGYYNPFMIATTVLAPVASGLLTTISLDDSIAKVLCLLGFLGLAIGIGIQAPLMALQTTMKQSDLPIGMATSGFGTTLASAIWIVVSATLFTNRLIEEMSIYSPSVNATQLESVGLSDIRAIVGSARLGDVLLGYDAAVTQTLYLPVGLTVATIIGSAFTEWHSVKKKQP